MMRRRAAALAGLATVSAAILGACTAGGGPGAGLAAQPVHIVFFEDESIAVGATAASVVRDAASVAQANPTQPVRVLGFAGPAGSVAANRALSNARALAVADRLQQLGVAPARIQVTARGEVEFADIATESRRVEIRIGPQ